jgi:hypothetical protein
MIVPRADFTLHHSPQQNQSYESHLHWPGIGDFSRIIGVSIRGFTGD